MWVKNQSSFHSWIMRFCAKIVKNKFPNAFKYNLNSRFFFSLCSLKFASLIYSIFYFLYPFFSFSCFSIFFFQLLMLYSCCHSKHFQTNCNWFVQSCWHFPTSLCSNFWSWNFIFQSAERITQSATETNNDRSGPCLKTFLQQSPSNFADTRKRKKVQDEFTVKIFSLLSNT